MPLSIFMKVSLVNILSEGQFSNLLDLKLFRINSHECKGFEKNF